MKGVTRLPIPQWLKSMFFGDKIEYSQGGLLRNLGECEYKKRDKECCDNFINMYTFFTQFRVL